MSWTGTTHLRVLPWLLALPPGQWFQTEDGPPARLSFQVKRNGLSQIKSVLPPSAWKARWVGSCDWWEHTTLIDGIELHVYGDYDTPAPGDCDPTGPTEAPVALPPADAAEHPEL
jgi:hypothetical protein